MMINDILADYIAILDRMTDRVEELASRIEVCLVANRIADGRLLPPPTFGDIAVGSVFKIADWPGYSFLKMTPLYYASSWNPFERFENVRCWGADYYHGPVDLRVDVQYVMKVEDERRWE